MSRLLVCAVVHFPCLSIFAELRCRVIATPEAGTSIAQTVINLSGKRDKILAFNYASLALNNSFFLNNLVCPVSHPPAYPFLTNSTSLKETPFEPTPKLRTRDLPRAHVDHSYEPR